MSYFDKTSEQTAQYNAYPTVRGFPLMEKKDITKYYTVLGPLRESRAKSQRAKRLETRMRKPCIICFVVQS